MEPGIYGQAQLLKVRLQIAREVKPVVGDGDVAFEILGCAGAPENAGVGRHKYRLAVHQRLDPVGEMDKGILGIASRSVWLFVPFAAWFASSFIR